jgi:hypothetical protein
MPESPLSVIFQMVRLLIENTVSTFQGIFGLFGRLLESLGFISSAWGPAGFLVSVAVVGVVGFFIAKLLLGAGKKLIFLFIVGIILAYMLVLSAFV